MVKTRVRRTRSGREESKGADAPSIAVVRASISFPPDVYEMLAAIARQKKVSLAWVVREAAEEYIDGKWPLFRRAGKE